MPSIVPLVADAPFPEDSHVLRGDSFILVAAILLRGILDAVLPAEFHKDVDILGVISLGLSVETRSSPLR